MSKRALVLPVLCCVLLPATRLAGQPQDGPVSSSVRRLSASERAITLRGLPVRTAHGRVLSQPPPPPPVDLEEREETQPPSPLRDDGLAIAAPRTAETSGERLTQTLSPGSFVVLRDSPLAPPTGYNSSVNEPNVGSQGDGIFTTHNWFAEISTDNGATYAYIDPYTTFPTSPVQFSGGFCCDQRVAQDSSRNLVFWYLQYVLDGGTPLENGVRIAVAHGQAELASNTWRYYDFVPGMFGLSDKWFDFPHLQASANFLYFTTNIFSSTGLFYGALVARLPLAQLDAGVALTVDSYLTTSFGSILAVHGAAAEGTRPGRTTMYFAAVDGSNSLKVLTWPEALSSPAVRDVTGLATTATAAYVCSGPDGLNPCGRANARAQTGWITDTELGIMWSSSQNGGSRPYPYTRVAILDPATLAVRSQPDIYSTTSAWLYPAVAVDERGHLGGVIDNLGGNVLPTLRALIRDDLSPDPVASGWETYAIASSTNGTAGRWGDYNGAMPHERYPTTWLAVGHVQNGGSGNAAAETHNLWFGRARDTTPTLTVTRIGSGSGTVTSSPTGIACGAVCSAVYPMGTQAVLTAVPAPGSSFAGWSGACAGTGTCTLTMDAALAATAAFSNPRFDSLDFYTLPACRLLDSRTGSALVSNALRTLAVAGFCGVPVDAVAVAVNVSVIAPPAAGHVAVCPGGVVPSTSTVNFPAGTTRANNAVIGLANDGTGTLAIQAVLAGGGQVDVAIDVVGYFR